MYIRQACRIAPIKGAGTVYEKKKKKKEYGVYLHLQFYLHPSPRHSLHIANLDYITATGIYHRQTAAPRKLSTPKFSACSGCDRTQSFSCTAEMAGAGF